MIETREQSTGGTCTWVLRLSSGQHVVDPLDHTRLSYDVRTAHVWFDEDRARRLAAKTPWIGASARAERARP